MKIFIKSLVLSSLFLSLAFSCSEDASSDGGVPSLGKVNATIDGKSWEGTNATGSLATSTSSSALIVAGTKIDIKNPTNSELISVTVYSADGGTITVGDYPVVFDALPRAYFVYSSGTGLDNYWYSTSGTVSITKMTDTNFQGTFNGIVTKTNTTESPVIVTKTITNGGFNVSNTTH